MNAELSEEEKAAYASFWQEAESIALEIAKEETQRKDLTRYKLNDFYADPDTTRAIFEKIAPPLVYLREDLAKEKKTLQSDVSHETPRSNEVKEQEKKAQPEQEKKVEGEWIQTKKNPDIFFRDWADGGGKVLEFWNKKTGAKWLLDKQSERAEGLK